MKNKHLGYTGLADLQDGKSGKNIDFDDFLSGKHLSDLEDVNKELVPSYQQPVYNNPELKKNILPNDYYGENWDDFYQSNQLETIRTQYPEHYEKLRKEKFKTKD